MSDDSSTARRHEQDEMNEATDRDWIQNWIRRLLPLFEVLPSVHYTLSVVCYALSWPQHPLLAFSKAVSFELFLLISCSTFLPPQLTRLARVYLLQSVNASARRQSLYSTTGSSSVLVEGLKVSCVAVLSRRVVLHVCQSWRLGTVLSF